jgi:hypothetical protein
MKWHDVEQSEDSEWMDLRMGKVGGSSIGKVMANYGKAFGNPAHDVALKIALEKITGIRQEGGYSNSDMERGHEQEPIARMLYEEQTFCNVTNGGFYDASEYEGISPDGRVLDSGLIEIKSVIATRHWPTIKRGSFNPSYKWQLLFNLKCSCRDWIDYVEYCSEFPKGKQLFIQRIHFSESLDMFQMIDNRMNEFIDLIDDKIKKINSL